MGIVKGMNIALIRSRLSYDPLSGVLTWRASGKAAGCLDAHNGYTRVRCGGAAYWAHRLAWAIVMGQEPSRIDHISGDKADNRWSNLREVTHAENMRGARARHRNNTSGFAGVSKAGRRWSARHRVNGAPVHLGRFDTPQEAHRAYLAAKACFAGR